MEVQAALAQVAVLPVSTWRYKNADASQRHLGPMAQDFYGAFEIGSDDKSICTVDEGGVALAAIQGQSRLAALSAMSLEAAIPNAEES